MLTLSNLAFLKRLVFLNLGFFLYTMIEEVKGSQKKLRGPWLFFKVHWQFFCIVQKSPFHIVADPGGISGRDGG